MTDKEFELFVRRQAALMRSEVNERVGVAREVMKPARVHEHVRQEVDKENRALLQGTTWKNSFVQSIVECVHRLVRDIASADVEAANWLNSRFTVSFGASRAQDFRRPVLTLSSMDIGGGQVRVEPYFVNAASKVRLLSSHSTGNAENAVTLEDGRLLINSSLLPFDHAAYLIQQSEDYFKEEAELVILRGVSLPQNGSSEDLLDSGCYYELWRRYAAQSPSDWITSTSEPKSEQSAEADWMFRWRLLADVVIPVERLWEEIEEKFEGMGDASIGRDVFYLGRSRWIRSIRTPLAQSLIQ